MFRPAVQVGDYLLAKTGWRPRRAWEATSNSRFVFRSSLPLLLPAVQTWERKYSSPYWLKMSFPWLGVVDVSTLLARIITADLESADLSRTTLGATSVSTVYSPAESIEAPTWKPNGTWTVSLGPPCAYADAAAKMATTK